MVKIYGRTFQWSLHIIIHPKKYMEEPSNGRLHIKLYFKIMDEPSNGLGILIHPKKYMVEPSNGLLTFVKKRF